MNSTDSLPGHCVRCQQDYQRTVEYRITHICRQCRNKLVAVWAQVTNAK